MRDKELVDYLLRQKLITHEQLENIIEICVKTLPKDKSEYIGLDRLFVKNSVVSEQQIQNIALEIKKNKSGETTVIDENGFKQRYIILKKLGSSGLDVVYKAYNPTSNRYVALKVFNKAAPEERARLLSEIERVKILDHNNIVSIYEVGVDGDEMFVVAQYVNGTTLDEGKGKFSKLDYLKIFSQVCKALIHAHEIKIIHRDIKPHNIMVMEDRTAFLQNFGISKKLSVSSSEPGSIYGTPEYISPEQVKGAEGSERSDVYSVGASLYFCLAGRPPFTGTDTNEILRNVLQKRPIPISDFNILIHPDIESIVQKAMNKNPELRYSSVEQLREDIECILSGETLKHARGEYKILAERKLRRFKTYILMSSLSALVAFGFAAHSFITKSQSDLNQYANQQIQQQKDMGFDEHSKLLQDAGKFSAEGKYDKAIDSYKKIIEKSPDSTIAINGLGDIYSKQGRYADAVNTYQESLKISQPRLAEVHNNIGKAYESSGNQDQALKSFQNAISIRPDYADAYNNLGKLYAKLGRHEDAKAAFSTAISYNKEFAEAYKNLGSTFNKLGRHDEAIEALGNSIKFNPNDADSFNELGKSYAANGRFFDAANSFKNSLKINPGNASAHKNLGDAYIKTANFSEAMDSLKKAIELNPDLTDAYSSMGLAQLNLDNPLDAIESCKKAIDSPSKNHEAYNNLGLAYAKAGKHYDAIKSYLEAIKLKPDYADAYNNMGMSYFALNRYKDALTTIAKAVELRPGYYEAFNNLGNVYHKSGDIDESIKSFKKAFDLKKDYYEAYNNLASVYITIGDYETAFALAQKAFEIKPGYAEAHNNIGYIHLVNYRYQEAVVSLSRALELKPNYTEAEKNLGFAYLGLRKHDEAIASFKSIIKREPNHIEAQYGLGVVYIELKDSKLALEQYYFLKKLDEVNAAKLKSLIDKGF